MHLLVVRRAGRRARHSQVEGIIAAEVVALESRARCIQPFVRTVEMKPWYHSSHVATSLCIVVIAISLRNLGIVMTEDRAGNCHE